MTDTKRQFLVDKARELMRLSQDPVHDLSHVERVVANVKRIAKPFNLSTSELEALELAAWWHDVARILTRQPSFVWMTCIDDILSALMLFIHTIRYGFWKYSGGVATRMIFSKNLGAGAIFTKLLIRKKERILLNILKDADMLDILNIERLTRVCELSRTSKKYYWGLKCMTFLNTRSSIAKMRTSIANEYLLETIQNVVKWIEIEQSNTTNKDAFGEKWMKLSSQRFTRLHQKLSQVKQTY